MTIEMDVSAGQYTEQQGARETFRESSWVPGPVARPLPHLRVFKAWGEAFLRDSPQRPDTDSTTASRLDFSGLLENVYGSCHTKKLSELSYLIMRNHLISPRDWRQQTSITLLNFVLQFML